ncbi:DNA-binding protein RFX2 isoform X2 [Phlebotomus papatasi]|uniref:DNA-binding protein RFX2 isoform X2 n=1 Tax=Phlebotomus papatasi TaxID=29031 RepID=UPI002483E532|nr:DNA-binding protein RFX2 isoform X2 [Phlebotomus papatasi]
MAARLATQRNFVAVTSVSSQGGNVSPASQTVTMTSPSSSNGENAIAVTSAATSPGTNGTTIPIALHQVLPQKIILQTTTTPGGVSVIDVVPLEHSDSSNESPITVVAADAVESTNGTAVVAPGAQQVTAQVAVVQTHSPNDSGPHYITVTAEGAVRSYAPLTTVVSSQDNVASHGAYHVQYVDSELYTTTGQGQTQMAYPVYAVGDYGTGGQQYYATATGNYTASGTTATNHSSSEYIVPVDDSLLSSTQTRASPQTIAAVAWLVENYETAEGVSLPRSTLYNHYMRHCNENKLDAVNAASFGKLIRSVFTGLRTRRLGTRGNSKYHYYGIRVKPGSTLMSALDEKPLNNNSSQANSIGQSTGTRNVKKLGAKPETYEACSQYLGDGSAAIPVFPAIDTTFSFPEEVTFEDVDTLRSIYREHCEAFLDAVLNLEFSTVESLWREFWRVQDNNNGDECEEEKYLSKSKLYILCQCEPVQMFIKQVDFAFYQNMVDVLIPDVLRPIPSSLTQAIRNFAKNLESWLSAAMSECPESILQIKLSAVSAFSQTLRRYTSLNHLAQAARAVLQNSSQIAQMLNDLNRVDFHNVQEQASWVCQCDTATVQRLENDFKAALQQQNTLEQWASWLRLVVDSALEEYRGKPTFAKAARQFLLKWSFYSSMVIRDLTLRSAASFGSFHLIRLLYDEYMFFIVEHKVAQATQTTPIAVMSEVDRLPDDDIGMMFPANYECKIEPEPKRMRS